jgi:hypothetical protein
MVSEDSNLSASQVSLSCWLSAPDGLLLTGESFAHRNELPASTAGYSEFPAYSWVRTSWLPMRGAAKLP